MASGLLALVLLLVAGHALPVRGQEGTADEAAAEAGGEGEEAGAEESLAPETVSGESVRAIAEILEQEEEALAAEGSTYDSGGRRDPFVPLVGGPPIEVTRPCEGINCLSVDEIDVTGVFVTDDGAVAQVFSTKEGKSFLLRAGDELIDGEVLAVTPEEVVFQQDRPTAGGLKPFVEVVKKLNP